MPAGRPEIPAALQRALMLEAGYRCAVPTCRAVGPLHFEHIEEWSKVKQHTFENMIVLCANCHGLKGTGPKQLDKKALKQLKANLGLINIRYNDTERRVLEWFAKSESDDPVITLPGTAILYSYLIEDGLIEPFETEFDLTVSAPIGSTSEIYVQRTYHLTEAGAEFVAKLRENLGIEL